MDTRGTLYLEVRGPCRDGLHVQNTRNTAINYGIVDAGNHVIASKSGKATGSQAPLTRCAHPNYAHDFYVEVRKRHFEITEFIDRNKQESKFLENLEDL